MVYNWTQVIQHYDMAEENVQPAVSGNVIRTRGLRSWWQGLIKLSTDYHISGINNVCNTKSDDEKEEYAKEFTGRVKDTEIM